MSSSTDRARAVVLALLMVGSVFGATIAFTGGAAAAVNSSNDTPASNASDIVAGYDSTQTVTISGTTVSNNTTDYYSVDISNFTAVAGSVSYERVTGTSGDVDVTPEANTNNGYVNFTVDEGPDDDRQFSFDFELNFSADSVSPQSEPLNYTISQYNNSSTDIVEDSTDIQFDIVERVSSAGHPEDLQRNETTQNLTANGNISIANVDASNAVVYVNMTTLDENGVDVDSLSAPSQGDVSVSGGTYSGDGSLSQNSGRTVMILPISSISGDSFNITKLVTGGELDVSQASLTDGLIYSIAATEGTSTSSRFNPNNDNYAFDGPASSTSGSFAITEVTDGSYIEQSTDNVTTDGVNATVNVTFVDDAGVNDDTINVSVSDARNDTTQLVRDGQLVNGTFVKNTIDDTNSTVEKTYVSINLSDGVYTINASAMNNASSAVAVGNSPTTFGSSSDPAFSVKTQTSNVENAGNVDSLVIDPDSGGASQEITASATISTTGKDTSFALDLNDDGLINESEVVVTATDGGSQDQEDSDNVVNVTLNLGDYSLSGMDNVSVLAIGEDGTGSDTDSDYAFGNLVQPDRTATYDITGDNTGSTTSVASVDVSLNRTKLVADDTMVLGATANVTDADGAPVSGVVLDQTIENGSDTAANVTVREDFGETNGDGVATLTLVANTSGYTVTVGASNDSVSGNATFGTIPGSPTYDTTSEVATYDSDNDGTISGTELRSAAADFRGGSLDMGQLQSAAAAFAS